MTVGRTQVFNLGSMTGGSGGGTLTDVTLDNSLFVSKDGDDATAQPYSLVNKYLTIQAAIDDAASGETVFVYPGTYTENLTISGGIRVHFFLGAIVNGQIEMSSGINYITGNGQFTYTGAGYALLISGAASTENYVQCFSITGGTGAAGYAVSKTGAGFGQINCEQIIGNASGTGPVINTTGGTLHCFCDSVFGNSGYSSSSLIVFDTGTVAVLFKCDRAAQTSNGLRTIYNKDGNNRIYFNLILGYIEVDGTDAVNIRGTGSISAIKTNPASTSIAPVVLTGTSSSAKIGNLMLAVEGGTGNAAVYSAAAQTVVLNGLIASNKALGANVSYTGSGVFVLDPNMDTGNP